MPYDESLAENIRISLNRRSIDHIEKKMFGGLCFLYKGKMAVGVVHDKLMVRVASGKIENELAKEYCTEMDFTGRSMKEFLYVLPEGWDNAENLDHYIQLGIEHAEMKSMD